jgi:hypothetical protein
LIGTASDGAEPIGGNCSPAKRRRRAGTARAGVIGIVAGAALLGLAPVAAASRAPSSEELAVLEQAVAERLQAQVEVDLSSARISTLDARFGAAIVNGAAAGTPLEPTLVTLRRSSVDATDWRLVTSGPLASCRPLTRRGVPEEVVDDLAILPEPCEQLGSRSGTLSVRQLQINQRISQAALLRINALIRRVDGALPPSGERPAPSRLTLSAKQLLINQRIAQAAVRRANELAGRLEGRLPTRRPADRRPPVRSGDPVNLTARQLVIGQRIAQAAVRRAAALAERIPDVGFPPRMVTSQLDRFGGHLPDGRRAVMVVSLVERRGELGDDTPVEIGDRLPVVFVGQPHTRGPFGDGAAIGAWGILHRGVLFATTIEIVPVPREPIG